MRSTAPLILLVFLASNLIAQKRPLDYSAINSWPRIGAEQISSNGKYISYTSSSKKDGTMLVFRSIDGCWKKEIVGGTQAVITEDNRMGIFKSQNDSLGIIELGKDRIDLLGPIITFKLALDDSIRWLAYQSKDSLKSLILMNLSTGLTRIYRHVEIFEFSNNGKGLLFDQVSDSINSELHSMILVHLHTGLEQCIWKGGKVFNFALDKSGSQISFIGQRAKEQLDNVIWYFKCGMDSAKIIVDTSTPGMAHLLVSRRELFFSNEGNNLFFYLHYLKNPETRNELEVKARVIVWRYQDIVLNNRVPAPAVPKDYVAVINLQHRNKVIRVEFKDGTYFDSYNQDRWYRNNQVLILSNSIGSYDEYQWRPSARPDLYLVSTENGTAKLLKKNLILPISSTIGFSPTGKYIFWFDRIDGQWYTYNITKNTTKRITSQIHRCLSNNFAAYPSYSPAEGIAGWWKNDSALLIYDNYDIWKVDPEGIKPPINLTFQSGHKNKVRLRILEFNSALPNIINPEDTLVLFAFNTLHKTNGFWKLKLGAKPRLIKSPLYPMLYYFDNGRFTPAFSSNSTYFQFVIKAHQARVYLLKPRCDTVYPNIHVTSDFVNFKPLTTLAPQKVYNWYTSSLMRWKRPDGTLNEGILFKPENFDEKKKYPVIVYIYERFSDALHIFLEPELSRGTINIPWYVSHGYLVFTPDIHITIGKPGESAYISVVSGVHYLSRMPWVNSKKIGLQGHSYGGFETNYIISRTNLFAAAASSAGLSDLVSESGQLSNGTGNQYMFESRQMRIGATLWQKPKLYLNNSPIFNANKVATPLLIMHNPLDVGVHFSQSLEWFTSLRRLGKKVWMLQYIDDNHSLNLTENQFDYSVRLNQFFDHFLMCLPTPTWMIGE